MRSDDRRMPRSSTGLVTHQLADLLLTTEAGATENLMREGADSARIHFVGNTMIDTLQRLLRHRRSAANRPTGPRLDEKVLLRGLRPGQNPGVDMKRAG